MAFSFVTPSTVKLDLGDGDWLEVKQELTAGELKAMRTASFTYMAGKADDGNGAKRTDADGADDVKVGVDWRTLSVARLMAYVVDWNAKDGQGRPVAWSRNAVEQLSMADFERLEKALNEHEKLIADAKNEKAGAKK